MSDKPALSLEDFDFGFDIVDAQELELVQQISSDASSAMSKAVEAEETAALWEAQAEQWKDKANLIYNAVIPLLSNLSQNPEKEYIYWPERVVKIDMFKLKLMQILED